MAAAVAVADVGAVGHVRVAARAAAHRGRAAARRRRAAARRRREVTQGGTIMHNTSPITRTIRRVQGACTCA